PYAPSGAALLEASLRQAYRLTSSCNREPSRIPPNRRKATTMRANLYVGMAFRALAVAAAYAFVSPAAWLAKERATLLPGKVVSTPGELLAGTPFKAHRENSPMSVAVHADAKGESSFPSWSDVAPGSYSVSVEMPDFERVAKPAVL